MRLCRVEVMINWMFWFLCWFCDLIVLISDLICLKWSSGLLFWNLMVKFCEGYLNSCFIVWFVVLFDILY